MPPRLYFRRARADRAGQWVILDGAKEAGTGASQTDVGRAEAALEQYLARKHKPPSGASQPHELLVDEVMSVYLREHAPTSPSRDWIAYTAGGILDWWSGKTLADVNGPNCRAYVTWRTKQRIRRRNKGEQRVSDQTARHELKTLRTAINYYHREHGPLQSKPAVTLPKRSPPREGYWLTRSDVAQRITAARRNPRTRHVARLILIGIYTGTRPGAILRLGWLPSPTGGWFDLEQQTLHRRSYGASRTRKRQPPARIHARLLPHLRRWQAADMALGIAFAVHYQGQPVQKLRSSWASVRKSAGAPSSDAPHILRHTAATWQMQGGTNLFEAAGYLGMSPETLWTEYGHHHPECQENAAQASPKKRVNRKRTEASG